ncbi:MAG: sugar phosphate isomerase/epimerase [Flavobacteriaceae bacterium]|nr:sugar phosphate isomerase/epimerase [Flavobacteriaceae bacterium]
MKFYSTVRLELLFVMALIIGVTISCKKSNEKTVETNIEKPESQPFFKLSLAQWSLHKAIRDEKTIDPLDFAQKANELGFEGIEYVSQLYDNKIKEIGMEAVLDSLKRKSQEYNVQNVLIMVDGEGDLAATVEKERNEAVEKHKKWVDAASTLGCHSIRVNTFGSNDPEIWVKTAEDGLRKLSQYAATKNINVLVENHGWLSSDAPKLAQVMKAVNMNNCGTLPDFGNWCVKRSDGEDWGECLEEYHDIYEGMKLLMPYAKAVSAKSYDFDAAGNQPELDYQKMLKIVKDAGYTGFIGVEYEGSNLSEVEGINATKALLLKSAKALN